MRRSMKRSMSNNSEAMEGGIMLVHPSWRHCGCASGWVEYEGEWRTTMEKRERKSGLKTIRLQNSKAEGGWV